MQMTWMIWLKTIYAMCKHTRIKTYKQYNCTQPLGGKSSPFVHDVMLCYALTIKNGAVGFLSVNIIADVAVAKRHQQLNKIIIFFNPDSTGNQQSCLQENFVGNALIQNKRMLFEIKTCGATQNSEFPQTGPDRNRSGVGEHF